MKVTHSRSIAKTLTWRILATITTFSIAMLIFKEDPDVIMKASVTAGIEVVLKLLLYYFHERIWNNVQWGRVNKEEN